MKLTERIKVIIVAVILLVLAVVGGVYACGQITLCHATGSATNPYVEITVADDGWFNGHINHLKDIIPMPAGGCPGPVVDPTETPEPTATDTQEPTATGTQEPTNTSTPTIMVTVTLTNTPEIPTEVYVTKTPRSETSVPILVTGGTSCCCSCRIDRSREIEMLIGPTFRITMSDDVKIDEFCWVTVYQGGKVKYQFSLAGWVVVYK